MTNNSKSALVDPVIDEMITWITSQLDQDYMPKRAEVYFQKFGKVFPEDSSYHQRMSYFLEMFCFQKVMNAEFKITPFSAFFNQLSEVKKSDYKETISLLADFRNSVFVVKKHFKNSILIEDFFTSNDYEVLPKSNESVKHLNKKEIFQGFIFCDKTGSNPQKAYLGTGLIQHPEKIRKLVESRIKSLRKTHEFIETEFLEWLSSKQILLSRHKKADPKDIYSGKVYAS